LSHWLASGEKSLEAFLLARVKGVSGAVSEGLFTSHSREVKTDESSSDLRNPAKSGTGRGFRQEQALRAAPFLVMGL
jgi:hypothetical protein